MTPDYDVYAYGMVSSSTLHLISGAFPGADGYGEITQSYTMTGGEAANSAIVLSRLGTRVKLDGVWIGDNPEGHGLLDILHSYQIDTRRLNVQQVYGGVKEIVFSDEHTRTVFGNYQDLFTTRRWNLPQIEDMAQARMVCLDPWFHEESVLGARLARQAGVPYVTIDCPYDGEVAAGAAGLVVSGEFRGNQYPGADLEGLFCEYQARCDGLVILTCGGRDLLFGRKGQPVQHLKPYPVQVIDSAGAGDSFRAAVLFGLMFGWNDLAVVRYASALAAMVCASFPGVLNSPTHDQVVAFIREREPELNEMFRTDRSPAG